MTLFYAFFLPVTVALGIWQVERGEEKTRLETQFVESQGRLPVEPVDVEALPAFARVRLEGHYDPERYLLLDNQTRNGRIGYAVISLFHDRHGPTYLINRGWIPAGAARDRLPQVDTPVGETVLTGTVWRDAGIDWSTGADNWSGAWPARIQRIDLDQIRASIAALAPVEIRIEPGAPGAFDTPPITPNFAPEMHYGYAVQWFLLAAVLTALYVRFGIRRASAK
jgi:cytochrome oxidase assembly protein ShyY1